MAEPEFETFEEEVAYYERRRADRIARVEASLRISPGMILTTHREGREPWLELVIVSRDTHPDPSGPVRATSFLVDGPWGHENAKTTRDIAIRIAEKSWDEITPASDADVIAWTSTPAFHRGTLVAALIQAGNALRFRARGAGAHETAAALEQKAHAMFDRDPEGAVKLLEAALAKVGEPIPNPSRAFVPNPAWVTSALAVSYDLIEAQVPSAWLPRFSDVRPGPRSHVLADLAELGCGGYGCVLPTHDAKVVLKVTTDTTEAEFATTLANELVAPVCVHYHLVVRLAARHRGEPIQLLWRDAADRVGKVAEDLGETMERRVNEQKEYAAEAYDAIYKGQAEAVVALRISTWLDYLDRMSRASSTKKPIADLFAGMHKVFMRQRILFGDVHAGNLGLVGGRWIIIDPGNIAVVDGHI